MCICKGNRRSARGRLRIRTRVLAKSTFAIPIAVASGYLLWGGTVRATTYTWTGGVSTSNPASGIWNTTGNWSGGIPSSSSSTELDFDGSGSTAYTSTNNTGSNFVFGSIHLNSSASVSDTIAESSGDDFAQTGTTEEIQQNGIGAFLISTNFSYNSGTLDLDGSGSGVVTLSGSITQKNGSHPGNVAKSGSSIFLLMGSSSYSAGTTISGGILEAGNASALGTGSISVSSGGTFDIASGVTFTNAATLSSGSTLGGLGTYQPGTISLGSGVTVSPGIADGTNNIGTLNIGNSITLGASNTVAIDVGAGAANTDFLNITGALNTSAATTTLALSMGSADQGKYKIIAYSTSDTYTGHTAANGGFASVTGLNANYRLNVTTTSGMSNAGEVDLIHMATIGLSSPVSATIITGGSANLGATVSNTTPSGSDSLGFSLSASPTTGSATLGSISNASGTLTAGSNNGGSTVSASSTNIGTNVITFTATPSTSGGGGLTSSSAVTQTATLTVLGHANPTLTSSTDNLGSIHQNAVVANQSATLTNSGSLIAGLQIVSNGGMSGITSGDLLAAGGSETGTVSVNTSTAGAYSHSYTITSEDDQTYSGRGATSAPNVTFTVTGTIYSGQGSWNVNGSGTSNWSDTSNWTALGGAPGLDANFQTGDTATFGSALTSGTATVDLNSSNPSISSLALTSAGSYTIAQGTGGTLTLNNGASAAPVSVSGTQTISAPIKLTSSAAISTSSSSNQLTVSGTVSSSGALSVGGGGTVVLSASNSYSGGTTINAATLVAANSSSLGSGGVTVNSGGTLDVGGGSPIALNLGSANLSQSSGSALKLQINNSSSGNYSSVTTTGSVTLGGTLNLQVGSGGGPAADDTKFQVINAGSHTGTFSGYTTNIATYNTSIANSKAFDTSRIDKTGQLSVVSYYDGFENVNGTWANNSTTFGASLNAYALNNGATTTPGTAAQVVNPSFASANASYGKLTATSILTTGGSALPQYANIGPLTRFNGNNNSFGTGFTTQAQVYIDPSWTGDSNGTGFDYSSAVSNDDANATFHRDFIFHVFKDTSGNLDISADNNSNYTAHPNGDMNRATISTAGWYTLQDTFRNNSGVLAVDMKAFDSSGDLIYSQTLSSSTDLISGIGGNNYAWFVNIDTNATDDSLDVDDVKLINNTGSGLSAPAITSGKLLLGSFQPVNSSVATFDIGGTNPGAVSNGYDYLDVPQGVAALSGDLTVDFVNGFESQVTSADSFTVFQAQSTEGSFDNVIDGQRVDTSDGSGSFLANYVTSGGQTSLVLSDFEAAVPEPTALSLLVLLSPLTLMRRHRRHRYDSRDAK
jgi:fibronectin-binding autotransporter adhesin